ncbi:Uncharacterised protein [Stenotrophomonas maltophilia]|nr:Uncharacterised protein [Stenotrophomonas maltophilia]
MTGAAGLRPAPAESTSTATSKAGIPRDGGVGPVEGDAVNPSMGAWSRLARVRCPAHTARPGLGVLPNPPEACLGPMRLTPPQPDPPHLRQFPAICRHGVLLWWVSTLVDTVDPRHAWMNVGMIEVRFCRVEPCSTASAWRSGEGVRTRSRWERDPTPVQNKLPCTVGCSMRAGASGTSSAPSRQARPPSRLAWRFNAACSTSALPATCSTWRARVRPV